MALRVDQASKAAALWPTAMKVYQSFCWRGVGAGRSTVCLIGALEKGRVGVIGSTEEDSDLAMGASGSFGRAAASLGVSETDLEAATESSMGDLGRSVLGMQRRSSVADRNKEHLSEAGRGRVRLAATQL